jgi:hypothetical protein
MKSRLKNIPNEGTGSQPSNQIGRTAAKNSSLFRLILN